MLPTRACMQVLIAHAEEVEQVFDAISYCKGACVVKMLNAVLGPDMFKKGLQVCWRLCVFRRRGFENICIMCFVFKNVCCLYMFCVGPLFYVYILFR